MARGWRPYLQFPTGRRPRLFRWLVGVAAGATLAIASPSIVLADLQLATIACSDGSQFTVSVDTATLTQLTNAITSLNTESLGLTCSITVQLPVLLGVAVGASSTPTQVYAVGGGSNDASTHFAFDAHVDPDTGALIGSAVIQPANQAKFQGSAFCFSNFGTTRFAVVGIQAQNPNGTTTPVVFQMRDAGPAVTNPASVWQIDPASSQTNCSTFQGDTNHIVAGNVVVRP